jgi:HSP20 family protein
MVRWNPYREMVAMQRALDNARTTDWNGGRVWRPALDVVENDDAYVVKATLPGLKAEDIDISIEDDVLSIKAEHDEEREESEETYLLRERRYGAFHRAVRLPSGVNGDEAVAEMRDGVLTLTLPKREEYKPKQIEVKVG